MQLRRAAAALMLAAAAFALAGCRDADVGRNNTAVLGGYAPMADHAGPVPTLTDASGQTIPAPPAPANARPAMARSGDESALAAWVQDDHVVASGWTRGGGWTAAQPLERIYGESSRPRIVSNGRGTAMAVWHHRVGNIHSLRFARFDAATGWSVPDVLPGALPRPATAGAPPGDGAVQLRMDDAGNVLAQWPSGFHASEMQVARYTVAAGWTPAESAPVASAPGASAALPAPQPTR